MRQVEEVPNFFAWCAVVVFAADPHAMPVNGVRFSAGASKGEKNLLAVIAQM